MLKKAVLSKSFLFIMYNLVRVAVSGTKLVVFLLAGWINRLKCQIFHLKCSFGKTSLVSHKLQNNANNYKKVPQVLKNAEMFTNS